MDEWRRTKTKTRSNNNNRPHQTKHTPNKKQITEILELKMIPRTSKCNNIVQEKFIIFTNKNNNNKKESSAQISVKNSEKKDSIWKSGLLSHRSFTVAFECETCCAKLKMVYIYSIYTFKTLLDVHLFRPFIVVAAAGGAVAVIIFYFILFAVATFRVFGFALVSTCSIPCVYIIVTPIQLVQFCAWRHLYWIDYCCFLLFYVHSLQYYVLHQVHIDSDTLKVQFREIPTDILYNSQQI